MSCYRSCAVLIAVVASFSLTVIVGCIDRPGRVYPPKIDPAKGAAMALEMYDANKDGKLDAEELKSVSSLARLAKDGVVTPDLIAERLKMWSEGSTGRVSWGATFSRNGKPLTGADIKLVPEKFLGTGYLSPTGKTNDSGEALLSVPVSAPGEPKGIPLGLYRIEVAKDGDAIPAKYNTESTLSVGVYSGQAGGAGPEFNLAY